jgi:hypothetical protein
MTTLWTYPTITGRVLPLDGLAAGETELGGGETGRRWWRFVLARLSSAAAK